MRDYDGPVFREGKQDTDKRHFAQRSARRNSERRRFEPVYQIPRKSKRQPVNQSDDAKAQVESKQARLKQETTPKSSTSGLEHYEIPFFKNRDKSTKTVDNSNLPSPEDGFMNSNSQSHVDKDDEGIKEPVKRTVYTPSYSLKRQADQAKVPFKASELPKPYKKEETKKVNTSSDTRELTKRLHKTKESFLLFENGEAINSNDE
ncbi:hypothetical protein ACF3NG_03525 [Aerococcaceae bacterium WGS1372]